MSIGHSRGGKTALWHGVTDERVSATFPLMSGSGGNGAMRVLNEDPECDNGPTKPCGPAQDIADINYHFPYWFTPAFVNVSHNEARAPWDQHFQRMLLAPRAQLGVEGINNQHENPLGSQITWAAARTIYRWLGVDGKIGTFFHPGQHPMNDLPGEHDWTVVADFADTIQFGRMPRNASLFNTTAYSVPTLPWSWSAPSTPP